MEFESLYAKIAKNTTQQPSKIALEKGEDKRTYQELEKNTNRIANYLNSKGINGKNVPLLFDNSIELVEAILGVLKAGGIFVPLDPTFPNNRIKLMLSEVNAQWVITQGAWLDKLEEMAEGSNSIINVLVLDEKEVDPTNYQNINIHTIEVLSSIEDHLLEENLNKNCYIYFTSGSMGRPKGILGRHKSLKHFIDWEIKEFGIDEGFRVSQLTSPSFDPYLRDVFVPLCAGATLCIPEDREIVMTPARLADWIEEQSITLVHMVPTLFKAMTKELKDSTTFRELKYILLAGELLRGNDLKGFIEKFQEDIQLVNIYGPTETTLAKFFHRITKRDVEESSVPVGKPIPGAQVLILNETQKELGPGGIGEIYIRTPFISSGYYNQPDLTREVFLKNPFSNRPNDIIYKTGDTGRILRNGDLQIMGRADHQVKIRGFRIEIGEIENRLLKHPSVKEAVVVAWEEGEEKFLCSYLMGDESINIGEVKEYLRKELPEYMIPTHILQMDQLPLTPNGKVDRKALPKPDGKSLGTEYIAPSDEVEVVLVEIWQEILGVERISVIDDFLQLGGHSLKATSMKAKIHQRLNVDLPLREIFKTPTIRGLGELIKESKESIYSSIEVAEEREHYPLSSAQRRMYVLQQLDKESVSYNITGAVFLEGQLDSPRLQDAFRQLIDRHDSLRTSFALVEGEPVQFVHGNVDFEIEVYKGKEEDVKDILKFFVRPFDLKKAPLLRVGLVELSPIKHLLVYDLHHIISDGTSLGILIQDFMAYYRGNQPEELRLQYKDYSIWQNQLYQSDQIQEQKQYWLQQFSGDIPVLNLLGDFPRPALQTFEGDRIIRFLDEGLTEKLQKLCKETGTTLYMVLLSIFNVLLSKYSGQEDIVVGSPIAGRPHGDLSRIMGMFVNTLPMRNYPVGTKTYLEFLQEVKTNALRAFENQDYQLEELVEVLEVPREMSRNPLFDVMFILQNMDRPTEDLKDLTISPYTVERTTSKFDLSLTAIEGDQNIKLEIEYATKLFRKETMERLYGHLENIIRQVTDNMEIGLSQIEMITKEEKEEILEDFNATKADYPREKTIHQLFEEQVERTPNNVAIVFEDKSLTYRQLNEKSNQLARVLVEKGVKEDTIVGIMVERSLEMLVGIMGIVKAGGAYLPLDPHFPEDRIQYMLEDSEAEILLTQSWLMESISGKISFSGDVVSLDQEDLYRGDGGNLAIDYSCKSLAYVIYTSGSTGKSKGAMIQHYSLVNRLNWMQKKYPINEGDVILQKTPFTFDVSLWELFWWSMVGAKVYMLENGGEKNPKVILETIEKNQITTMHFVPSMLSAFLEYMENNQGKYHLNSLKQVFASGEALGKFQVEEFNKLIGTKFKTNLINLYGPTEATVDVSYFDCEGIEDLNSIPIGKPIDNINLYITDGALKLQPIGVAGELCIAGDGLARGYLNRPQLTAEKFVANPFIQGERMYRTGDLARWMPDGNIEFLGRLDHQVKMRGYRIELGEIEAQLLKHEAINGAVVIAKEESQSKYLCGYIVGERQLTFGEVREHLSKELPDYMIPSYIIQLEEIPLTPNGKINRSALPEPEGKMTSIKEYEAPRNKKEEILVGIWEEVLKIERVGINDNFFELGGHSLKATKMVAKVHQALDVEIPLNEVFKNPTIKGLMDYIKGAEVSVYSAIEAVEEKEYYPTSPAQRRIYTLQQFDKEAVGYNMPGAVLLKGNLDLKKLEDSFRKLIQRHEALRTSFKLVEGVPVQEIHQRVDFSLQFVEGTEEVVIKNFIQPFDLTQAPLFRVGLMEQSQGEYLLIFDLHHIISDGVSMEILVKEFVAFYGGKELEDLRIQYKDYSEWQNRLIASGEIEAQRNYWVQQFSGEIPVLNLMGDYSRPAIQSFEGNRLSYQLEENLTSSLRGISKETGSTLYMILLSAFNVLLSKYSGQEDIIVGSPIAGRPHGDLSNIMGVFINTLAMRNFPVGEKTFREFLLEVKNNALRAYENQDYQFEELVEQLNFKRDISRNPLFDVMFNMKNMDSHQMNIDGLTLKSYDVENNISKFDLTLGVIEGQELYLTFEYSSKIFKEETIKGFYRHFENILRQMVADLDLKLSAVQLVTEEERQQLLLEFNNTEVDIPKDQALHQLFEEQAEKTPSSIALKFQDMSLTYSQLNSRANQLARLLMEKGVQEETIVGIMVEPSLEMLVGILAILKAGGAYLPIDPKYPIDRIQYMLQDSQAFILLTQTRLKDQIEFAGEMISIENEELYRGDVGNLNFGIDAQSLAYIIYTSGSTGRPKGVMIEHYSGVNFIKAMTDTIDFAAGKSILALTTISFDIFFVETLLPLTQGLRVVIASEEEQVNPTRLKELLEREKINMLQATPSRMKMILEDTKHLFNTNYLKEIMVGGEALPTQLLSGLQKKTQAKIYNMYGPTETTIWSTIADLTEVKDITIGKPVSNTEIYIVDENNQLQPIGGVGELCIGGEGLARGYLNRPELTAEKFVDNPFKAGKRMYRTGDLARWRADGRIEFLGRLDHQVKIRGYRIELEEIENQLLNLDAIKEAVVLAREEVATGHSLWGYITGERKFTVVEIRDYLRRSLPEYMIPTYILQLEEMPLTANGKIDRRALRELKVGMDDSAEYQGPRNKTEEKLVEIWQGILGKERVGIHDDFFELGGNSINILKIAHEIEEKLEISFPVAHLYVNNTIEKIAAMVGNEGQLKDLECVIKLNNSFSSRNIFIIHGMDGDVYYYKDLAKLLEDEYRVYGIQSKGLVKTEKLPNTPKEMIQHYIKEIKEIQPEGPYIIAGYCAGAIIGYDLVRELEDRKEVVEKLILIDEAVFLPKYYLDFLDFKKKYFHKKLAGGIGDHILNGLLDLLGHVRGLMDYKEIQSASEETGEINGIDRGKIKRNVYGLVNKKLLVKRKPFTPTAVIKAEENRSPMISLEMWQQMVEGDIEVYESSGNHETMLNKDHAGELANRIKDILELESSIEAY